MSLALLGVILTYTRCKYVGDTLSEARMDYPLGYLPRSFARTYSSPDHGPIDPALVGRWLTWRGLNWSLWLPVLVFLLYVPRYPLALHTLAVATGVGVGLGNTLLAWLLRRPIREGQLEWASILTQILGWTVAAGGLAVFVRCPSTIEPAVLLIEVVAAGLSAYHGLRGYLGAVLGAAVLLSISTWAKWRLGVLDNTAAREALLNWGVLLATTAVFVGVLVRMAQEWHRREAQRLADQQAEQEREAQRVADQQAEQDMARRQADVGLTEREREILTLLADEDLELPAIAARLFITHGTAKVHVRNIRRKLRIKRGGRERIVAMAREGGLLPPAEAVPVGEISAETASPPMLATVPAGRMLPASEFPRPAASTRRSA